MKFRIMSARALGLVMALFAVQSMHGQAFELTVENDTDFEMQELYAFSNGEEGTGPNRIEGNPIFPGGNTTISVHADDAYVLAVDSDGDRYLVRDVRPAEERLVTLSLDDLSFNGFDGESGTGEGGNAREVQLVNETNRRITGVWYRKSNESEWTEISLSNPLEPDAAAEVMLSRAASPDVIGLRAEDEDGDIYTKTDLELAELGTVRFSFDDLQW
ncbi:MAG: hypothetical protein R6V29_07920 [Spirochaetia bacterium]